MVYTRSVRKKAISHLFVMLGEALATELKREIKREIRTVNNRVGQVLLSTEAKPSRDKPVFSLLTDSFINLAANS